MNQHFTEAEFSFILGSGKAVLDTEKQFHLNSCPECRAVLAEQAEADRILKDLKPQILSIDLSQSIINRIEQTRSKSVRLNGLIAASIILTAILVAIQVFTTAPQQVQTISVLDRLTEQIREFVPLQLKMPQILPQESLPFSIENLMHLINVPFVNLFFFICFVLSAYLLADQYLHKTMARKH